MKKWMLIFGVLALVAAVVFVGGGKVQNGQKRTADDTEYTDGSGEGFSEEGALITEHTEMGALDKVEFSDAARRLLDASLNYAQFMKALKELGSPLTAVEITALREMLGWPTDTFSSMRPIEANAVKNDVLTKLIEEEPVPAGLATQVAEMSRDAASDPVWRDYCVQFLAQMYERLEGGGSEYAGRSGVADSSKEGTTEYTEYTEGSGADSSGGGATKSAKDSATDGAAEAVDEKAILVEALVDALEMRGNESTAGTALIGLNALSQKYGAVDRAEVLEKASKMAADDLVDAGTRVTALRMVGAGLSLEAVDLRGELLEAARMLAQTGETDMLRAAAIMTLGECGEPADRELLESFVQSKSRQVSDAAKMALSKWGH